jgi:hypothetical protein
MSIIPITKKIFLSSENSDNGTKKSVFSASITGIISRHNNVLYSTIKLLHCEIPVSFYVINEHNNRITINNINYVFDYGNYNANTFIAYFNNLTGLTLSISTSTGKFKLTSGTSFTIYNIDSTCQKIMGFDSDLVSVANEVVFSFPCNFIGTQNIVINSNNLIVDNYDTKHKNVTTIANIQKNVSYYKTIYYTNMSNTAQHIKNIDLDKIEIELRDDNNKLIDFNNIDSFLTFEVIQYMKFFPNQNLDIEGEKDLKK